MYLLNQFKRKLGSKNTKLRKDKGIKRNNNIQDTYIKSKTVRSNISPYIEVSKEARLWANLAHKNKKSSSNGINNTRQTIRLVKDVHSLTK